MEPETDTGVKIWVLVRWWPGGKKETLGAYFHEDSARIAGGKAITQDSWISIESVPLRESYESTKSA